MTLLASYAYYLRKGELATRRFSNAPRSLPTLSLSLKKNLFVYGILSRS